MNKAKSIYPDTPFIQADIHNLPFVDNAFPFVTSVNVITSLAPPPDQAIKELVRISEEVCIIRMLIGVRNYIVKTFPEENVYGEDSTNFFDNQNLFTYRNIYLSEKTSLFLYLLLF